MGYSPTQYRPIYIKIKFLKLISVISFKVIRVTQTVEKKKKRVTQTKQIAPLVWRDTDDDVIPHR